MSGEGPDSIPTSADPRSRRPVKKRALTPVSEHAKQLDALFSKPDQEIRVPTPPGAVPKRTVAAPPEIVTNVQGSSAGAGSGEFHVYKASRRREYDRLRAMDEEVKQEKDNEEFARKKAEREAKDEERTRRNREKREKKKQRAKKSFAAATSQESGHALSDAAAVSNSETSAAGKKGETKDYGCKRAAETASDLRGSDSAGLVIHDDD